MPTDPRGIGDVDAPCPAPAKLSNTLIMLGFDPRAPIYRATPLEPFNQLLRELAAGLCGRDLRCDGLAYEPVHLSFRRRDKRYEPYSVRMWLELLQVVHAELGQTTSSRNQCRAATDGLDRITSPDFYMRGLVLSPPSGYDGGPRRFHGYIQAEPNEMPRGWPHGMIVQITSSAGTTSAKTSLSWGVGVPTVQASGANTEPAN